MDIYVDGSRYIVNESDAMKGGQANVYRLPGGRAAKIFLTLDQKYRERIEFLCSNGAMRPLNGVASIPQSLTQDAYGRTTGYVMQFLDGHTNMSEMFNPSFYDNNGLGIKAIVHCFLNLHKSLSLIHQNGFYVVDFNQFNTMVRFQNHSAEVKFIDADSWCYVNSASGKQWYPEFLNDYIVHPDIPVDHLPPGKELETMLHHDWFAYAMLLAICLFKNHPFGIGFLPSKEMVSKEERMKKRLSVWHKSVSLHRGEMLEIIRFGSKFNAVLRNWVTAKNRGVFPAEMLLELYKSLVRCPKCRFEVHSGLRFCPGCFSKLPLPAVS